MKKILFVFIAIYLTNPTLSAAEANKTNLALERSDGVKKVEQKERIFYKIRNYLIYRGAAVWALNVLDAYISDKDFDSALKTSSKNSFTVMADGIRLSFTF